MTNNLLRLLTLAALLMVGSLSLSACNTMSGAGEDLEAAGDAMSEEAEENKGY